MDQVVQVGHFTVRIGEDREVDDGVLGFVDVLDPLVMRIHRVHGQGNGFDTALGEFILEPGSEAQLGGAHRRKVCRMGKQHTPAIAQPFVETEGAGAGILFEIGGDIAKSETHGAAPGECLLSSTVPAFLFN